MPIIETVRGKTPVIHNSCYISPNATIVGEVEMGANCTVWFNAVIRGDVHFIKIGEQTNIQDGAVIHCTYQKAPTTIGSRVSIAHNAIVHGCTVEDEVLIGMGAIVMDHAIIKKHAVIAAGAVVLSGTIVEEGAVYAGTPAKKVKETSQELKDVIARTANNYPMYAGWFKEKQNLK